MDLDAERLRAVLRTTRIGRVTRHELGTNISPTSCKPAADSMQIEAQVPAWLIASLEQGPGRPHANLSVFSTLHEEELWAVLSVHRHAGRLSFVLPLAEPGIQAFLRQGLRRGAMAVVLATDEGELSAIVDLELPLADGVALERLLLRARCLPGSLSRLVHFVETRTSGTLIPRDHAASIKSSDVVVVVSNASYGQS